MGLDGAEAAAPVLHGGQRTDDVGVEEARDLIGIANGVVEHVGEDGGADAEEGREEEREQHDSARFCGKTGLRPGRAVSATRMELFWKLALMPASLILRTSSS